MRKPFLGHPPPPVLLELAACTRRLMTALLRVDAHHRELDWAREMLDEVAERIERVGCKSDTPRLDPAQAENTRPYYFPGNTDAPVHFAVPWMEIQHEGFDRHGRVRFELLHEGPPGLVHGGYLAWFFDTILGQSVVANDLRAPTAALEVRYRRPTPIQRNLRFESALAERNGRTLRLDARLLDGEQVLAEATGTFVEYAEGRAAPDPPLV